MKKVHLIFALALVFGLSSCFDEDADRVFEGAFLEFAEVALDRTPDDFASNVNDGAGALTTEVNLVGAHRSSDLTVTYTVDPESTAVAGTHYTTSGTLSIPANSSFGTCEVSILDASIPTGESVTLILVLQESGGIAPSENFRRFTYVINGQ